MTEKALVTLVTASSEEEAESLARALLDAGEAACVNLIPKVRSLYLWKGELCDDREVLMIIKSSQAMRERVVARVRTLHSYDLAEVLQLSVSGGSKAYLKWLSEASTRGRS